MIENTNTKQFYPGPILNNTLEITDFLFNDAEQIKIKHSKLNEEDILIDVDLNYPTDYEVTKVLPSDINAAEAALTASTGQVMLKNVNVLAGEKLTVYRVSQIIQDKDYPRTGAFPAATHEGALDYLTMQNQEQQEELNRALKVPISTGEFNAAVPVPLPNRILRIDENATGFEFVPYDLDERLDTFEDTVENTLETNKSELEASFNNFKLETEELIEDNKQEVLSIQSDYQKEMDSKFQTVSDAADKINILDESIQLCKDSAEIASEKAETATNKANEILNVKDELEVEIDTKANVDLSNLSSVGEKHFLNKQQITNCLLEVPQRIKLELNDGTLTLKAGSQVIVPNGFEEDGVTPRFDYVDIESDISQTLSGSTSDTHFVSFLGSSGSPIGWRILPSRCYSGSTVPTQSGDMLWYDTSTNLIKYYQDNIFQNDGFSFPIALCTRTSGTYTSIDQTFNGLGCIGSTVWEDKDVNGLIPNGKNKDGSLKNIERTTPKIITRTLTNQSGTICVGSNQDNALALYGKSTYSYDGVNNLNKDNGVPMGVVIIAEINATNGKITSFNPKQPFRAVDYSDKAEVSGWSFPSNKYIDLTLNASGSTYTAPANGWVSLSKIGSNGHYIGLSANNIYSRVWCQTSGTASLNASIPVSKGATVTVVYNTNGITNFFGFIYAQGEV